MSMPVRRLLFIPVMSSADWLARMACVIVVIVAAMIDTVIPMDTRISMSENPAVAVFRMLAIGLSMVFI